MIKNICVTNLIILFLIVNCNINKDHVEIVELSNNILKNYKNQKYNEIVDCFSEFSFKNTPREKYLVFFESMYTRLGPILSWEMVRWEVKYIDGTYYIYYFKVQHKKYEAIHHMIFVNSSEKVYQLQGYKIESVGLNGLIDYDTLNIK